MVAAPIERRPRRSRVLGLLAIAWLLAVVGCGDEEGSREAADKPPASGARADSPRGEADTGKGESRFGYSVELPEGWRDLTEIPPPGVEAIAGGVDRKLAGYYLADVLGTYPSGVLVGVRDLPRPVALEVPVRRALASLRRDLDAKVSEPKETELDGAEALEFEANFTAGAETFQQRIVIAKHGLASYQVVYSSPLEVFSDFVAGFEQLRSAWRWDLD